MRRLAYPETACLHSGAHNVRLCVCVWGYLGCRPLLCSLCTLPLPLLIDRCLVLYVESLRANKYCNYLKCGTATHTHTHTHIHIEYTYSLSHSHTHTELLCALCIKWGRISCKTLLTSPSRTLWLFLHLWRRFPFPWWLGGHKMNCCKHIGYLGLCVVAHKHLSLCSAPFLIVIRARKHSIKFTFPHIQLGVKNLLTDSTCIHWIHFDFKQNFIYLTKYKI